MASYNWLESGEVEQPTTAESILAEMDSKLKELDTMVTEAESNGIRPISEKEHK